MIIIPRGWLRLIKKYELVKCEWCGHRIKPWLTRNKIKDSDKFYCYWEPFQKESKIVFLCKKCGDLFSEAYLKSKREIIKEKEKKHGK